MAHSFCGFGQVRTLLRLLGVLVKHWSEKPKQKRLDKSKPTKSGIDAWPDRPRLSQKLAGANCPQYE